MAPPSPGPRAREVLELLVRGVDRPAIARALGMSRHTVDHHVDALRRVHGGASATELVARVLGERLKRCEEALAAIDERSSERRRT